jgi:hypothetical protein
LGWYAGEKVIRMTFTEFIAIDWSGARPGNYKGKVQVAVCEAGQSAPKLLRPRGEWTRTTVAAWLREEIGLKQSALIGMDFSFSAPFVDTREFLPGLSRSTAGKVFWHEIDDACDDEDFGAAKFLEQHRGTHFYLGKADGEKARFMRLRQCEIAYNNKGGRKPSSVFDAIGAAQVAKASFAGMRLLHHVNGHIPVWPFDKKPVGGPLLVEIYCQSFIRHAGLPGKKVRDLKTLNQALQALGSAPLSSRYLPALTDDMTDALISSAGLRMIAKDARFWQPAGLTLEIAATEGWTFGVL